MADALYASPLRALVRVPDRRDGARARAVLRSALAFAVTEAHRRGLELHAWFNPYRARHPSAPVAVSPTTTSAARGRTLVHEYGRFRWMDPASRRCRTTRCGSCSTSCAATTSTASTSTTTSTRTRRTTRDGAVRSTSPTTPAGRATAGGGGTLSRDDWRRENVDRFVERLYREIKREKPHVKFGISPFGIWRPGHPPQIRTGFDQYAAIYADARKWLLEGWLDYFAPQLYWPIAQTPQSYPVLLRWWVEQNPHGRHIWPGNFTSRVFTGAQPLWPAREILGQIYVTRGQPGATGNIHFSMRALMIDPDSLVAKLRDEAYAEPALAPASTWLSDGTRPGAPAVRWDATSGAVRLVLEPGRGAAPWWWVVRLHDGEGWRVEVLPAWRRELVLEATDRVEAAVVTAVDRIGIEGAATAVRRDTGG
jgi:uncharacterized lipoprotein YddW (UPF0748 family)